MRPAGHRAGWSFARRAEDVEELRRQLQARKCSAHVIVKIEKPQAVEHLEAIVAATVEVAVRTILGQVHVDPEADRQVVLRSAGESVPVPAEVVDRVGYLFVG